MASSGGLIKTNIYIEACCLPQQHALFIPIEAHYFIADLSAL